MRSLISVVMLAGVLAAAGCGGSCSAKVESKSVDAGEVSQTQQEGENEETKTPEETELVPASNTPPVTPETTNTQVVPTPQQ